MAGVRWKKLACGGEQPEPRWGHTSSQSGSSIIVVGGTGSRLFNDICIYDTVRNTWSKPEVRGTLPTARLGHSTTTLPDGKLLVFGGRAESKHYADMYLLTIYTHYISVSCSVITLRTYTCYLSCMCYVIDC